jgi:hypothetical protein
MAVDSHLVLESWTAWTAGIRRFTHGRFTHGVAIRDRESQPSIRQTTSSCNILPPVLQHKQRSGSIHSTSKLLRSRQGALACFDRVHVTKP